jgi:hypothetical protein
MHWATTVGSIGGLIFGLAVAVYCIVLAVSAFMDHNVGGGILLAAATPVAGYLTFLIVSALLIFLLIAAAIMIVLWLFVAAMSAY